MQTNIENIKSTKRDQAGFTIIEIIAILLVIAVVAVVAISRITSTSFYTVASEAEILKANIRYAQFRAMSDADTTYGSNNITWGISLSTGSYTLKRNGNTANTYFPGESSATHTLPSGISMSGSNVIFDIWGSPGGNNIGITVTDGAAPQTITITKTTGFIP